MFDQFHPSLYWGTWTLGTNTVQLLSAVCLYTEHIQQMRHKHSSAVVCPVVLLFVCGLSVHRAHLTDAAQTQFRCCLSCGSAVCLPFVCTPSTFNTCGHCTEYLIDAHRHSTKGRHPSRTRHERSRLLTY